MSDGACADEAAGDALHCTDPPDRANVHWMDGPLGHRQTDLPAWHRSQHGLSAFQNVM